MDSNAFVYRLATAKNNQAVSIEFRSDRLPVCQIQQMLYRFDRKDKTHPKRDVSLAEQMNEAVDVAIVNSFRLWLKRLDLLFGDWYCPFCKTGANASQRQRCDCTRWMEYAPYRFANPDGTCDGVLIEAGLKTLLTICIDDESWLPKITQRALLRSNMLSVQLENRGILVTGTMFLFVSRREPGTAFNAQYRARVPDDDRMVRRNIALMTEVNEAFVRGRFDRLMPRCLTDDAGDCPYQDFCGSTDPAAAFRRRVNEYYNEPCNFENPSPTFVRPRCNR